MRRKHKCCKKPQYNIITVHNHYYGKTSASEEESTNNNSCEKQKVGLWKAIWLIITNKESKTGTRTAYLLARIMGFVFNIMSLLSLATLIISIYTVFKIIDWSVDIQRWILQAVIVVMLLFGIAIITVLFRGIANEIKAEKDRNYIMNFFFGLAGLASLIVALISLSGTNGLEEIIALLTEIKDIVSK